MNITVSNLFALLAEKADEFDISANSSAKTVRVGNPMKPLNYIIFEIWASKVAITTYEDNKWSCGGGSSDIEELSEQLEAILDNIR